MRDRGHVPFFALKCGGVFSPSVEVVAGFGFKIGTELAKMPKAKCPFLGFGLPSRAIAFFQATPLLAPFRRARAGRFFNHGPPLTSPGEFDDVGGFGGW